MNFGLSAETINMIQTLFRTHPEVKKVKIYGSRALGNYRKNSDIDLVVWGAIDEALIAKLKAELDELPLPYFFDVQNYADITHLPLREHIDSFAKDFYNCSN